jgi:hypothetical protein
MLRDPMLLLSDIADGSGSARQAVRSREEVKDQNDSRLLPREEGRGLRLNQRRPLKSVSSA